MASAQLSRVLWQSSRCARLEAHRSTLPNTSILQRRTNYAAAATATASSILTSETSAPSTVELGTSEDPAPSSSTETADTLEGETVKPKRKRRTRAELLAAAEEEANLKARKRRTKAEMLALSEEERLALKYRKPGYETKKVLPRPKKLVSVEPIEMDADNPTAIPFLNLPPMTGWKEAFAGVREGSKRPSLRNPETARMLAEKIIPEGSKDKVVIEAFSGPGQLSRALLKLPRERIRKLIIVESVQNYWKYVKPLEQIDDRVSVVQMNARDWGTYTQIEQLGLLKDVEVVDWEQVHPQLHFIMQMGGGVDGELVGAQLLRTIPDRQWLFKFGRMPMNLILSDRMWERFRAPITVGKQGMARCKVSVMAQSVAHLSQTVHYDALQPYGEHFHPERYNVFEEKFTVLERRRAGTPHVAAGFLPMKHPLIKSGDLDFWDYVVRKLFVVKATPLEKSISALGPGAYNILKHLTNPADSQKPLDITKSPRSLTVEEWTMVVQAFKNWPFRPTDLGIEQMFVKAV